jgi:hypothetical protein
MSHDKNNCGGLKRLGKYEVDWSTVFAVSLLPAAGPNPVLCKAAVYTRTDGVKPSFETEDFSVVNQIRELAKNSGFIATDNWLLRLPGEKDGLASSKVEVQLTYQVESGRPKIIKVGAADFKAGLIHADPKWAARPSTPL